MPIKIFLQLFPNLDSHTLIVNDAQPFDSGNYRCVARNRYTQAFAAEVINVEGNNSNLPKTNFLITIAHTIFSLSNLQAFTSLRTVWTTRTLQIAI